MAMNISEAEFVRLVKAVLDEVVPKYVKEYIDNRIPPNLKYHTVYKDGAVIGYYPYFDINKGQ